MKKLLVFALVAVMASFAVAEEYDEFGLWVMGADGYENSIIGQPPYVAFEMFVTVHNTSVETIGGYEASVGLPAGQTLILGAEFNGGTNFGDNTNHLVGFPSPITAGDITVLGTLNVMLTAPGVVIPVELGPSVPSSVDGAGPAYADGANADDLILCGYITGMPHVFTIGGEGPVATENLSLSNVKALFN